MLLLSAAGAASGAVPMHRPEGKGNTVRHDITFVAMLLPHHQTAVEMASVAQRRAATEPVRRLATHIVEEQGGQIRQMRAWLERRDAEPMPAPPAVQQMEQQDLRMLRAASGLEVDQLFLMMMRPHHAQAVAESMDELEHGRDAEALALARTGKADQSREIAQMNRLLEQLD